MTSRKKPVMRYKRKRTGKTDYAKRLKLLLSKKPRLVIRKSNTQITAQIAIYEMNGDKTIINMSSSSLRKAYGWNYSAKNIPAAYLLGLMVGKQALSHKISEAVVDIGMQRSIKGSRLYAVAKGAVDAGLKIAIGKETFPAQERILGNHISEYSKKTTKNFSKQRNQNVDFGALVKKVEEIKTKVLAK